MGRDALGGTDEKMAGENFLHTGKYTTAIRSGGTDGEDLIQTLPVQFRPDAGNGQDSFQFRCEQNLVAADRVEERLYTRTVAEQDDTVV